jgi:hypothetical protein
MLSICSPESKPAMPCCLVGLNNRESGTELLHIVVTESASRDILDSEGSYCTRMRPLPTLPRQVGKSFVPQKSRH